jgi:DNA-directed RNA polymerase specialized sigma24 family protein
MILMMLKVDGLNVKQVSLKLKMSEGSIRVAASRGYKKIRELIEE